MDIHYQDLGVYSDIVGEAFRQADLLPLAPPGQNTQDKVGEVLGFNRQPENPLDVRTEQTWEYDGVAGETLSWSVGFGPRTEAYVLKPAGVNRPMPGIVALHDHGGYKYYGKEKIADGPHGASEGLQEHRQAYGNRAYANALARYGFTVLVHDVFLWGSRRFPLEEMPHEILDLTKKVHQAHLTNTKEDEIAIYNLASGYHEHLVSKYSNLLGTSMAGVVCREDRIAVNYLLSRHDVLPGGVGCIGLSGGGNRAALLQATHGSVRATIIVGMMSTYQGLLDHNVQSHTWMFFPFGWSRYGDWPDLAACRAPSPLLVQYDEEDPLFTLQGMRDADKKLRKLYELSGKPQAYTGQFYPGPHKFDLEMQAAAFEWLKSVLSQDAG